MTTGSNTSNDNLQGIIYNASTGTTTCAINTTEVQDEAFNISTDSMAELEAANAIVSELEIAINSLSDDLIAKDNEITSLKELVETLNATIAILEGKCTSLEQENVQFKLDEEIKSLVASIKSIDPDIDSDFINMLTPDQLTILNASLARVSN